jgi:hypothetical protein
MIIMRMIRMIIMIRMIRMIISHIGSKLFGYSLIDLSTIDLLSLVNNSPDLEVFMFP